ncbi:MAG: thiamine diphosphokinase [Spirochaetales bacterium]|nr:thiamine diphosphokinase [Spirochaetales bacterium]
MNTRTALIFTGGKGPSPDNVDKVIHGAVFSIAADSGWDLAKRLGIEPDIFIGDMDSLEDHDGLKQISDDRKLIFPIDKDFTDTELALKYLNERKYRDIVLIGGGGGRIDHLMAIITLFSRSPRPSEWYTSRELVLYIDHDREISCSPGQTISIFACGRDEAELSTSGLKWELNNSVINETFFSISNTALSERLNIRIKKGAVLVILNY